MTNPDTEMAKIPVALANCMTAILALPAREAWDATADLQALAGDLRGEAAEARGRLAVDLMDRNQWTLGELAAFIGVSSARAGQITSEARRPDPRTVYVMGGADQRYVKIGYASEPQKRLAAVQHSCPFALSILWQREGGAALESAMHRRFADYRRQGEWFEFPADQDAVEMVSRAAGEFLAMHDRRQAGAAQDGHDV